ncbi:MAG: O-antigen ligase family protein [Bacteroidota bacterium]
MNRRLLLELRFVLLLFIMFFPIIGRGVTGILMGLFVFLSVWGALIVKKRGKIAKRKISYLILFSSPVWASLISLIYTENINHALSDLGRFVMLALFPLAFFLSPPRFSFRQKKLLFSTFLSANVLVVLISFFYLGLVGGFTQIIEAKNPSYTLRTSFTDFTSIHPTYAGISFAFCLILLILFEKSALTQLFTLDRVRYVLITLFIISLSLLQSRMPLIALVFIIVLITIMSTYSNKRLKRKSLLVRGLFLLVIVFSSLFFSPRIKELIESDYKSPTPETKGSVNIRIGILDCTKQLLKDHWIIGLGRGDVQDGLNNCYKDYSVKYSQIVNHNTHNQYFDYWLSTGLLGLVLFMLSIVLPSIYALKGDNLLYFSFLLLFAICFLTENILVRNYGIVLFGFYNSFFAFDR